MTSSNYLKSALIQTTSTESFILIAWKLQILDPKNLWGGLFNPPGLDVRGLNFL